MKTALQKRAGELGFDACRVTTAAVPASATRFQAWLDTQQHGDMNYLQRNAHKRVDPQKVLPAARSIIALAISYASLSESFVSQTKNLPRFSSSPHDAGEGREPRRGAIKFDPRTSSPRPFPPSVGGGGVSLIPALPHSDISDSTSEISNKASTGRVARYACYADYHDVIGERLKTLTEFVNQLGGEGTRSLWYIDTGPLLERDLAQRAGIGFIGKHTNLISRQLGNWFFLAEIITTLELEPDSPEKNRCGSCTRCLAACPTQAITAPFQLDARRCISYLTIELKGPIPLEFRTAIGNRIYGCDDCLEACPWNRFAREGRLMKEHIRRDLTEPDLLGLLSLDEAGFKRRFAGTPILRAKRRGLLRNVCVALGNVGDATALPALERAEGDPEQLIAEHARWAVEQIRSRS